MIMMGRELAAGEIEAVEGISIVVVPGISSNLNLY